MRLSVGLGTDPGPREGVNQDSALAVLAPDRPDAALLIVADGMGGHKSGERASQQAVQIVYDHVLGQGLPTPADVRSRIRKAIQAANLAIHQQGRTSEALEGMGCTVVVALIMGDQYWVASVGDSRAYLVQDRVIRQLTEDHTWVNARVQEGLLTPDEAAIHSLRHVLDRALGPEEEVEVDCSPPHTLEAGDVLVLCSDGLYDVVSERVVAWAAANHPAQEAAEVLIARALDAPAHDNVTVAVLRAGEPEPAKRWPLDE